ncbi:hypothetical protein ACVDG3_15660, partial [Meridianimarinicoccus sp. RP-17]
MSLRDAVQSFQATRRGFHAALRFWRPLLLAHLFIRLVTTAVLVPVIGALLAGWLSFSNQSALTDQDIARFLSCSFVKFFARGDDPAPSSLPGMVDVCGAHGWGQSLQTTV